MTVADPVRTLAQPSPVKSLMAQLGELKDKADRDVANLAATLKHIDETRDRLSKLGITMTVDLGPIGNAAANERRNPAGPATKTFSLPGGVAA